MTIEQYIKQLNIDNPLVALTDRWQSGKVIYGFYKDLSENFRTMEYRDVHVIHSQNADPKSELPVVVYTFLIDMVD